MCKLDPIYQEASEDFSTSNLSAESYTAYMFMGVKITKDEEGVVKIYDPTKKGEYYREFEKTDYEIFKLNGWKKGVYIITLKKYKERLESIKDRITWELNTTKSNKKLKLFKLNREQITKKYYIISQKLNQI